MHSSIQPGTVLGGRYLLLDLLDDIEGARTWRAVDQVLERNVAAWVVAEADPRSAGLLRAAQASATVTDPHLLRVLDADVDHGLTWVVSEWGAGESLDVMIAHHALPADRAAWLVREAAAAIAVAHAHGIAHGRLAPENVMVTESGTARLIGFALDATLQRGRLRSGNYPGCTPLEADLFDLAGLLYAGLVGSWPGASGSHVKAAPRDARGPLRPRQVRAGVPRPLDAICGRVLGRAHPDRTAHQLSAVLTEYIGELAVTDPALQAIVLPELDSSLDDLAVATGSHEARTADEPVVPAAPGDTTTPLVPSDLLDPVRTPAGAPPDPLDELQDGAVEQEWRDEDTEGAPPEQLLADPPDTPDGPAPNGSAQDGSAQPDDDVDRTQQVPAGWSAEDAAERDPDWHRPTADPVPPAPPFEPLPERPLFAPEGTRRTPRGEVPASATAGWGTEVAAAQLAESGTTEDTGNHLFTDTGSLASTDTSSWEAVPAQRQPHWPLGQDDPDGVVDDWEERTRRPWLRLPFVVAVLAVIAVLAAGALALTHKTSINLPGGDHSTPTPTTTRSGETLKIARAKDLDPFAVPPEENPDEVGNAIDGDPSTSWNTVTYRGRPDLGGLKPGVGLVLDLGSIQRVGSVDLQLVGDGTSFTIFSAPTASTMPTGIEGLTADARKAGAPSKVTVRFTQPVRTRYVVVWLTSLPQVSGGYRGGIAEVVVRS